MTMIESRLAGIADGRVVAPLGGLLVGVLLWLFQGERPHSAGTGQLAHAEAT